MFVKLGPKTFLDRRGSSCNADCTKKQPGRPILMPIRGTNNIQPDCRQVPSSQYFWTLGVLGARGGAHRLPGASLRGQVWSIAGRKPTRKFPARLFSGTVIVVWLLAVSLRFQAGFLIPVSLFYCQRFCRCVSIARTLFVAAPPKLGVSTVLGGALPRVPKQRQ